MMNTEYAYPSWMVTDMTACKCGGKTVLFYDEGGQYHVSCTTCKKKVAFKAKSTEDAKAKWNRGVPENPMTAERAKQLLYCTIQMLRKEYSQRFNDWKDRDDWLFSELDMESGELMEVFEPYPGEMVYSASCFEDGKSPKNYDKIHFCTTE